MLSALIPTAVLAIIALALVYFVLRRSIREQARELRSELQQVIELASLSAEPPAPFAGFDNFTAHESEALDPETLSAIGVSVSTLLGKNVRISSVPPTFPSSAIRNTWAQEGCVAIQHSHELPMTRSGSRVPPSVRRPAAKAAAANKNVA